MDNFIHHALFKKIVLENRMSFPRIFFRELGEEGSYGIEKLYPL